ncbi:MAG: TRAP transporter large permease [Defluviitaleaceae bacterium]|nr:TRAP transporter large permease [Defluviitaleaceae bacterium]
MLLVLAFLGLLILGVPIAIVIGLTAVIGLMDSGINLQLAAQRMYSGVDSFTLMSIPFFIFAGDLMLKGGTSKRLINFANVAFGWITGGASVTAVASCMLFSALSGSSTATVAGVGKIMIPNLIENKYPPKFAVGILCAAGSLGIILPPSIIILVYGVVAEQSIGALFIAAIIPGLFIGFVLIAVAVIYSKIHKFPTNKRPALKDVVKSFGEALISLLMPLLVLGSIYTGVTTVTEAASLAIMYSFVTGFFIYKELKPEDIFPTARKSVIITSMIMFVMAATSILSWYMTFQQIPITLANAILQLSDNPIMILLLVNALLLLIGMVIDPSAAVLVLTPLLLPVVTSLGVDPIHFGIIMVVNLGIGFLTPPAGLNLFVAVGISKLSMIDVVKGCLPFVAVMIAALMVITYVPWLSLVLVR